jgi:uncharacterized protein (TIRG00374 family)
MKTLRVCLGLVLTAGFVFLFLRQVEFREVGHSLGMANYFLAVSAVSIFVFSMLWRALRWREILSPVKKSSLSMTFRIIMIGYMANNLLFLRLGELVRAYIYGEEEDVSKTTALTTILVERVIDLLTLVVLLGAAYLLLSSTDLLREIGEQVSLPQAPVLGGIAALFLLLLLLLFSAAYAPETMTRISKRIIVLLPGRWHEKCYGLMRRFIDGTALLKKPRRLGMAFVFSIVAWLTEASMYYVIGIAFSLDQPYTVYLVAMVISNLLCIIPSAMAGIGAFDWGLKTTLVFFGVEASVATASTIVIHTSIIVATVPLGLVFLWVSKRSLSSLIRYAIGHKTQPDAANKLEIFK